MIGEVALVCVAVVIVVGIRARVDMIDSAARRALAEVTEENTRAQLAAKLEAGTAASRLLEVDAEVRTLRSQVANLETRVGNLAFKAGAR